MGFFYEKYGESNLALQKSGRLSDSSLKLLKQGGIHLPNGNRKLKTTATDFPLEVLFLPDDDIPQYVEEGVADLGVLGKDVVLESQKKVSIIRDLGFSRCRLCLAVPRDVEYGSIAILKVVALLLVFLAYYLSF
jgi:ATP phosphoribosyltransferase